jgi:hypothetical protein
MKKIYNVKVSTIVMILLPILSIFIGYFGVKLYLLSNNNYNDEIDLNRPGVQEIIENNEDTVESQGSDSESPDGDERENQISDEKKRVTNAIGPINYYSIQVGSFSKEENAKEYRNQLIEKDYFVYYLQDNNYKVYVAASYNQETLEDELEAIKSSSPDAFVKNISVSSKNFSYTIDETDYFTEIRKLIADQFNGIDSSVTIDQLENELMTIEKINKKFIAVDVGNQTLGTQVTKYIEDLKKEVPKLDSNNENSINEFLEKNISLFIKYFL